MSHLSKIVPSLLNDKLYYHPLCRNFITQQQKRKKKKECGYDIK